MTTLEKSQLLRFSRTSPWTLDLSMTLIRFLCLTIPSSFCTTTVAHVGTRRYQEAFGKLKELLWLRKSASSGLSWRLRCLSYFYIAGFLRYGSTDFMSAILTHPVALPSFRKEVICWNRVRLFAGLGNNPQIGKAMKHTAHTVQLNPATEAALAKIPRTLNDYLESFDYLAEIIRTRVGNKDIFHPAILGIHHTT
ncbi:hypothetical protein CAPTEDRAFT_186017 [Capitella teleta]|uniref:Uncharacterized protein n=1 Tax=Capitella teleta TaxID=283909 RepID=R7VCD3_CAPTE|nr:hypothetical protein CAPTEDRAFT_186017 [Capitella teleta]|eukprot:ELU13345.1 hypothetical protein CAPTEDRAFT_186017 [Capitella teleta]